MSLCQVEAGRDQDRTARFGSWLTQRGKRDRSSMQAEPAGLASPCAYAWSHACQHVHVPCCLLCPLEYFPDRCCCLILHACMVMHTPYQQQQITSSRRSVTVSQSVMLNLIDYLNMLLPRPLHKLLHARPCSAPFSLVHLVPLLLFSSALFDRSSSGICPPGPKIDPTTPQDP